MESTPHRSRSRADVGEVERNPLSPFSSNWPDIQLQYRPLDPQERMCTPYPYHWSSVRSAQEAQQVSMGLED